MHRSRLVLIAALTLGLTGVGTAASAAPSVVLGKPKAESAARKNIAVGRIEGQKSSKIRLALMQRLKESSAFTVTDAEDLKANAGKAAIAKMAKALGVDAVLLGTVKNGDLTVMVYKPDGRLSDQIKVRGGTTAKLEKAIQNEFDVTIAPPLAQASGAKLTGASGRGSGSGPVEEEEEEPEAAESPAAAASEPAEEAPPPAAEEEPPVEAAKDSGDDKDKKGGSKRGRTPLELTPGLRGYSRSFEFTGVRGVREPQLRRTIRPYNLDIAPALMLHGVFYPGAFFSDGIAGNIGLMGGAEIGIATGTDYEQAQPNGAKLVTPLKTRAQAWDVGLRGRIPIGPAEIALFVEYGSQSFILLGDEGGDKLSPLVPDVKYMYVRPGIEPRVQIGHVMLGAHFAPRFLTSLHQVDLKGVWFSNAKGSGLDFGLWFGYGLAPFFALVAGVDFVGYGFDFNPLDLNPKVDPLAVGGATDYYKSLWLGGRFLLGNK